MARRCYYGTVGYYGEARVCCRLDTLLAFLTRGVSTPPEVKVRQVRR